MVRLDRPAEQVVVVPPRAMAREATSRVSHRIDGETGISGVEVGQLQGEARVVDAERQGKPFNIDLVVTSLSNTMRES